MTTYVKVNKGLGNGLVSDSIKLAITWTNVALQSNVLWHSSESNVTRSGHDVFGDYTFKKPTTFPRGQ